MVDLSTLFAELNNVLIANFGFDTLIHYFIFNGVKVLVFISPFLVVYWAIKFVAGVFYR